MDRSCLGLIILESTFYVLEENEMQHAKYSGSLLFVSFSAVGHETAMSSAEIVNEPKADMRNDTSVVRVTLMDHCKMCLGTEKRSQSEQRTPRFLAQGLSVGDPVVAADPIFSAHCFNFAL